MTRFILVALAIASLSACGDPVMPPVAVPALHVGSHAHAAAFSDASCAALRFGTAVFIVDEIKANGTVSVRDLGVGAPVFATVDSKCMVAMD